MNDPDFMQWLCSGMNVPQKRRSANSCGISSVKKIKKKSQKMARKKNRKRK